MTCLIYLSPFLGSFVGESFIKHLHDLVEGLTGLLNEYIHGQNILAIRAIRNFLHQRGACSPRLIIRCFSYLARQRVHYYKFLPSPPFHYN